MSSEPQRDRLPFEPTKSRSKTAKESAKAPVAKPKLTEQKSGKQVKPASLRESAVPEVVSRRMVRRVATFCGIPTALGISTFFVSYAIVVNDLFPLPHVAVVLVSMGFFGLGVLGLSYGVLSASWDEETLGSPLGWSEFTINLGRMTEAWRSAGKKS